MTARSLSSCVILAPAAGLLPWQRACVAQLAEALDVSIAGWLAAPEARERPAHASIPARWLDISTQPRTARGRRVPDRMRAAPRYALSSTGDTNGCTLDETASDWIRARRPDFVLAFDVGLLHTGQVLAPAGTWYFVEGSTPAGTPSYPALDALVRGETRLSLSLTKTAETGAETTLAQGHTPAVLHSRKRSLARLYEIAPDLLHRAIRNAATTPSEAADTPTPIGWRHFLAAMLRETARRWYEKIWLRQRWNIGLLDRRVPIPDARDLESARWMAGPKAGFWADPCFLAEADTPALLVEEYRDDIGRGEITKLAWAGNDTDRAPAAQRLLRLDDHLSFPRSYGHAGVRWLVPEMAACGAQLAFELDGRGERIDRDPVAIAGLAGIDPVLFTHAGTHWAFVSPAGRRANYQLDLYMADDFFGPYRRHPASPVRIDPHGGRSAGPVIRDGQRLLRFGQVFGRHYGEAIDVFEISTLSETRYAERRVDRIRPADRTAGMHTIDFSAHATVIDRSRFVPVWRLVLARYAKRRAD